MKVKRRDFLKGLLSLPVVGALAKVPTVKAEPIKYSDDCDWVEDDELDYGWAKEEQTEPDSEDESEEPILDDSSPYDSYHETRCSVRGRGLTIEGLPAPVMYSLDVSVPYMGREQFGPKEASGNAKWVGGTQEVYKAFVAMKPLDCQITEQNRTFRFKAYLSSYSMDEPYCEAEFVVNGKIEGWYATS